jgi:hypothetical protein
MCKNPLLPRAEKNLPLIFTDDADLKGIAVIAVIARHRRHRELKPNISPLISLI